MIKPADMTTMRSNPEDEDDINDFTARAITVRPADELVDDGSSEIADLFDEDEFRLDGLGDSFSDSDIDEAADEELSIVDAYEIGVGYGLDEEELAKLTGKPD